MNISYTLLTCNDVCYQGANGPPGLTGYSGPKGDKVCTFIITSCLKIGKATIDKFVVSYRDHLERTESLDDKVQG